MPLRSALVVGDSGGGAGAGKGAAQEVAASASTDLVLDVVGYYR